jgi:hypothetical protein
MVFPEVATLSTASFTDLSGPCTLNDQVKDLFA